MSDPRAKPGSLARKNPKRVTTLQDRLRIAAASIRMQSILGDFVPLLQEAADALDAAEQEATREWVCLEDMNAKELRAYEYGCAGMFTALGSILDGKDKGEGVANEPWEGLRRRVLALMQSQDARVKLARQVEAMAQIAEDIAREEPRFTCPHCAAVSFNPHDIEQGYCGRCRAFTGYRPER